MKKNLKTILEKAYDWWRSFLRHTWKEFEYTPEKEESGKILGKDLWVRAHSKKSPLKKIA